MNGAGEMVVEAVASERTGGWLRIGRQIAGWFLIALGLLGLIVPVLPGFLFLIPGLGLIAPEVPWARRALEWSRARLRGAKES
jgi:hypothetical protein